MTQYEYKVIKCSISWQEHYTSFLSSFGWQVQNIQQTVDRIVNNNVGLSTTIWGFGIQQGTGVQDVETSLTITFVRDLDMPNRHEIIPIENRFWDAHPAYRKRAAEQYLVTKHGDWPEFQVLMECNRQALAIRNRKTPQVTSQSSSQQPVSQSSDQPPAPVAIPTEPATAVFKEMEVTHNVFQSDQPGMQIRLHFNIKNRKGLQCRMVAYFCDANQNPLKDVNQKFKTADGKVSVGSVFTPGYEDCYYNNYILFMPYAELDQQDGEFDLGFDARIYDEVTKSFLTTSSHAVFHFSQHGETLRGENTAPTQTASAVSKTASRGPAKASEPAKPAPAAKPSVYKPSSGEEMRATFQTSYGWENPSEDQNLFLDAIALDWAGKSGAAEKLVKKAIELNPKEPRYWQNLVMGSIGKQKYDQAQKHIYKALDHMPDSPFMLNLLGRTHVLKGEFDEAQAVARRLQASEDESAQIQYNFLSAEIAEKQQDYKTAIRFYDKADSMLNPETQKAVGFNQKRCRDLMKAAKKK